MPQCADSDKRSPCRGGRCGTRLGASGVSEATGDRSRLRRVADPKRGRRLSAAISADVEEYQLCLQKYQQITYYIE